MKLATFNMESFGADRYEPGALRPRLEALRPKILELDADILCLQEVNAQKVKGAPQSYTFGLFLPSFLFQRWPSRFAWHGCRQETRANEGSKGRTHEKQGRRKEGWTIGRLDQDRYGMNMFCTDTGMN